MLLIDGAGSCKVLFKGSQADSICTPVQQFHFSEGLKVVLHALGLERETGEKGKMQRARKESIKGADTAGRICQSPRRVLDFPREMLASLETPIIEKLSRLETSHCQSRSELC